MRRNRSADARGPPECLPWLNKIKRFNCFSSFFFLLSSAVFSLGEVAAAAALAAEKTKQKQHVCFT